MRSARNDSSAASHSARSSIGASGSGLAIPVVQALAATVDDFEWRLPVEAALGQILAGIRVLADLGRLHRADRQVLERCIRGVDDLMRVFGPRGNEGDVAEMQS